MKKIVYSIFSLLLALAGCTQDNVLQPEPQTKEGSDVTVRFITAIPEYNIVQTRANGGVNDMWVLVFDQNGTFMLRKQATLSAQTETGGTFTVTLPSSNSKRYVHFVCNYDWTGFVDSDMIGANAAAVVALMSTSNATFWASQELTGGINATCFNGITVQLLRNQAKISVSNEAANFTLQGFTIHKAPNEGTIAPFNTATYQFEEHAITEPVGVTLNDAVQTDVSLTEKYLFERKNKNASEITTVIVQGTYNGTSYFYKIDLIDAAKVRYNIERNYHYMVKIKTVTKAGYTSFTDALNGASHNNTALDPIIEKYPMISDGTSKLEVEKTLVVFTQPGQPLNVWYKFFPDATTTTVDNTGVTVSLTQNDAAIAPGSLSFDNATGIITATAASVLPAEPAEARIVVSKGDLARTIRVVLRTPFAFTPVTINDLTPATLTNQQNTLATLRFTIPNDFPADLLPLPIKIYTQGLYPAASGLQMIVEQGVVHYVYMATATGVQTVEFKTNKSDYGEIVTLKADYFIDGTVRYNLGPYQGNITYGNNTNVPANATVTASVGSMQITASGVYQYTPPANPNMNAPVTLTYDIQIASNTSNGISQTFHERYTVTTTIGHLQNNGTINLGLDKYVVTGRIQYTTRTGSYYALQDVPANTSVNVPGITGASVSMLSAARYQLIIPATTSGTTNVRINYVSGSNTYWAQTTLNNLRTNRYYQLRTNEGRVIEN